MTRQHKIEDFYNKITDKGIARPFAFSIHIDKVNLMGRSTEKDILNTLYITKFEMCRKFGERHILIESIDNSKFKNLLIWKQLLGHKIRCNEHLYNDKGALVNIHRYITKVNGVDYILNATYSSEPFRFYVDLHIVKDI